jgi:quercetin dioxygenase-like cupin family protein
LLGFWSQRDASPERLESYSSVREQAMYRAVKAVMFSISLLGLVSTGQSHAQEGADSIVRLPSEIVWKAPALSPGLSTAVLSGDPSKPGVSVVRQKFPAGHKVMPHTHPDDWRTVVVLSGTHYFAVGDTWDETKLRIYPTGTFFSEPKGTPHFVWAKDGEVVIQITGMGPSATKMIPPKP